MKTLALLLLLFPLTACSPEKKEIGKTGPLSQLRPVIRKLENGIPVYLFSDDRLPVFDLVYVSQIGSKYDPTGKSGTSEWLAKVIPRGAGEFDAIGLAREFEKRGASLDVATGEDHSTLSMHGLVEDFDSLLGRFCDVVLRPRLDPSEIEREKRKMLDQFRMMGDRIEFAGGMGFLRLAAAGTPYGRAGILGAEELSGLGRDDLVAMHAKWLDPRAAVILGVGRFDESKLMTELEEHFGKLKGPAVGAPLPSTASYTDPRVGERPLPREVVVIHRKKATQAFFRIGFGGVMPNDPDYAAALVASTITGGSFQSRLNQVIRDELGLTYGIESALNGFKDWSVLTVSASTRSEKAGEMLDATLAILARMGQGEISDEEVKAAQEYLVGQYPLGLATLPAYAVRFVTSVLYGLGEDFIDRYPAWVQAVKPDDVRRVVRERFHFDKPLIVVAGDADVIEPRLRAMGYRVKGRIDSLDLLK